MMFVGELLRDKSTINGVTVVVTKKDYDSAVAEAARAKRDGRHQLGKQLPVIAASYLFCHASAKTVPDTHKMGWLSNFDDLKKVARVERRKDIYVPFLPQSALPVEEQIRLLEATVQPGWAPETKVNVAREYLLHVVVPQEVMYPKQ